jgi:hypothetical protein
MQPSELRGHPRQLFSSRVGSLKNCGEARGGGVSTTFPSINHMIFSYFDPFIILIAEMIMRKLYFLFLPFGHVKHCDTILNWVMPNTLARFNDTVARERVLPADVAPRGANHASAGIATHHARAGDATEGPIQEPPRECNHTEAAGVTSHDIPFGVTR